jgi:hypothetical protein
MKRSSYRTVDPGLLDDDHPLWRALLVLIIVLVALLVLAFVWPPPGEAAPLAGNKGGCGRDNLIAVSCTVTDSGVGFVSGTCEFGYWFSRVSTGRTFPIGRGVTARGCIGLDRELYAPIRISSR